MNIVEFLEELSEQGIELWAEDGRLRYRAPKEVLTTSILEKIKEYKPEILQLLSQHSEISDEKEYYPLSHGQRALWFLYKLAPDSSAYNIIYSAHLQTDINIEFLEKAFDDLVERHPILRTTYLMRDDEPKQKIQKSQKIHIAVTDASTWNQQQLDDWITKEADCPFNLETGPVFRVNLLAFPDSIPLKKPILLFTIHHIAADFWSFEILIKELEILYQGYKTKTTAVLPRLNQQFKDYVQWEAHKLASTDGEKLWNYWKQQLSGELPLLNLPTDRPRPPLQTYVGTTYHFDIDEELTRKLRELAKSEGVTLYTTILTAFQVLLFRYSGQEDILIGSPLASRSLSEFENLIGYFVNPVVLRANLSGNPTFKELLYKTRRIILEGLEHKDFPFPLLVEKLQPVRDPSRSPLFQVSLAWDRPRQSEQLAAENISSKTVIAESLGSEQRGSDFDMSLIVLETDRKLQGHWGYNSDLFDEATIKRMVSHLQVLLKNIVINPEQKIAQLPILTEAERHQLLIEWNDTKADYPHDKCIHQLFEEQVEKTPEAVAVVYEEQQLTYKELNSRANQLAHYLQQQGVGPEVLVGICVERSLEMVLGLLGILKAGGAYVPLDPSYPQERLAYMLEDSAISVLLTQERLVIELPQNKAQVVCLDRDWNRITKEGEPNLLHEVQPNNLAYLIYTSGSTGKPKGVMIEHQSLVSFTQIATEEYGLKKNDRVLQFASISFDAAAEEIYPCLSCGGTLVLRTDEMLDSGAIFLQQCQDWELTVLDLPTAYWQQLTAEIVTDQLVLPESLRLIIIGGEQATPERVRMWQQYVDAHPQLINTYGPTEGTIVATKYKIPAINTEDNLTPVPIGRPLGNVETYILDRQQQPIPVGVSGELHIGGSGVARAYLKRPELTAEKFICNPFRNEPDARLYKTGDLVRYLPDGNIEFLGRIDNQVKIRGFRIELGEIEILLNQHPEVREGLVIAREDQPGNKRLVAYLVSKEQKPSTSVLRDYLKTRLPDYMVPSAFINLEAMPLTPNGKIDRCALPAPDANSISSETTFVPPRTPTEELLAKVWSEVLSLEKVGIHDNFFELGGDSILSLQVIARANQADLQLTPKQILQYQSIAELAVIVRPIKQIQEAEQGLVTGSVPLTPIQQWFFDQNLPDFHHYNQSVLLAIEPHINPELLKKAVEQLLVHHDALRLRFTFSHGSWQQFNASIEEAVPFQTFDLSDVKAEVQREEIETIASELQASLNFSSGPTIRVALLNLGIEQPSRLLIIIHHLVVDGVSWRILLEDLFTAYHQLHQGQAVHLPPKTTSFKNWAEQITEYGSSETLSAEINYWMVESCSSIPTLPVDFSVEEDANLVVGTAEVSVSLSAEETRLLLKEVPQAYNTQINDVLLTALVQSFAQWTGERSLLIDLEGHGREELFEAVNLSRTVGWFTTVFPVLLKLGEINHPGKALQSVKEQLRCIPRGGIGYGVLRYLCPDQGICSKLEKLPQAEVSFNYLGQFDQFLSASPILGLAEEYKGRQQSHRGKRSHLLQVEGVMVGGQLQIDWIYSQKVHRRETVEELAEKFMKALKTLISHCQSPDAEGYTPSDFPEANLSQEELDLLLKTIN